MAVTEAMIRVRMGTRDTHYAGNLVAGARLLELFGDVATELAIKHDGNEGLLRAYSETEFLEPLRAGDYVEVRGRIASVGKSSRRCEFEAYKVIAAAPAGDGKAEALSHPPLVARATATVVNPDLVEAGQDDGEPGAEAEG